MNTYDDTIMINDIERATANLAIAATALGLDLEDADAAALARAALETFSGVLVVEDETSSGLWRFTDTRIAIRRRLRDQAAVRALDAGATLATHPIERVHGVGAAGEAVPVDEADTAVVVHTYYLRSLLPRPERESEREDERSEDRSTGAPLRLL